MKAARWIYLPAFSATVLLLSSLFCFLEHGIAGQNGPNNPTNRPNIIYILADDLGYGDLGCYGQTNILTPNLDRMAAEGLRFTQHYAGAPVCAPSRGVLMQGLHTGHSWVRGNAIIGRGDASLPRNAFTVGRMLHDAGYVTGCVGKWGLGYPNSVGHPNEQGFDFFYGFLNHVAAHSYYPSGTNVIYRNRDALRLHGTNYTAHLFNEAAAEFVRLNYTNGPFFLYLCPTLPHFNMHFPPAGVDSAYANQSWPTLEKMHATMVSELDRSVGRVLELLQELGIDDNTLVIFSSDNGPHAEVGHSATFFNSSGSLRGKKRDLYEGGIRVPMLSRWPSKITPGTVSSHVSTFWDVAPTLAELSGARTPSDLDGISFFPTLLGRSQTNQHSWLYWEFYEATPAPRQAVRLGHWKGVRLNQASPIELYDLAKDLRETNDLASTRPDIVGRIDSIMRTARTPSPFVPNGLDPVLASHDAWFPFNECAGEIARDHSRFTNSQARVFVDYPEMTESPWMPGRQGMALHLNGGFHGSGQLPLNRGITGANPRSISAWIKTATTGIITSWGDTVDGQKWTFRVQSNNGVDGAIRIEVHGGYLVGSTSVHDNQWHHVAVTWENDGTPNITDAKLYVDGTLDGISASSSMTVNTANVRDVLIGRDMENRYFTGLIDELRIYSRALSGEEISELYSDTNVASQAWLAWFLPGVSEVDWHGDTDNDGSNELSEYAFGTDPQDRESRTKIAASLNNRKLRIQFPRRVQGSHDLNYVVQASRDLVTWSLPAVELPNHLDSSDGCLESVTFETVNGLEQGERSLFLRLRVELK